MLTNGMNSKGLTMWSLILVLGFLIVLLVAFSRVLGTIKERSSRQRCQANLRQISIACHTYASDHNEIFPDKLSRLHPTYMEQLSIFTCPHTDDEINSPDEIDARSSYVYVSGLAESSPSNKVLIYDKSGNHRGGSCEVYVGGDVKWKPGQIESEK